MVALVVAAPVARGALPAIQTAPNTPAGERVVRHYLQSLGQADRQDGPNYIPVPGSARVVFSAATRYGEYTIWAARTKGARGSATVFSSPRLGISSSSGVAGVRLPKGPFVQMASGGASPPLKVREMWGQTSSGVARVQVVLKDGSRQDAILERRWFLFTQDFGHPKPVALLGYDRQDLLIARNRRRMF
jgi:hypothetical protein